jgi:hypothetical protein
MVDFMPEPHTLFIVVVVTDSGKPLANTACRAGAWPRPAGNTQPIIASEISAPARPVSLRQALVAVADKLGDETPARLPWNEPMGVRRAATITTDSLVTAI